MLIVLIILLAGGNVVVIERPGLTAPECQAIGEEALGAGAVRFRCVERFDA